MLPCSAVLTAIQAEKMEGYIIHAWFRCLLQLPPSHDGLTELTRYLLPLQVDLCSLGPDCFCSSCLVSYEGAEKTTRGNIGDWCKAGK